MPYLRGHAHRNHADGGRYEVFRICWPGAGLPWSLLCCDLGSTKQTPIVLHLLFAGILYTSKETHYSVMKAARMYRMDAIEVRENPKN